MEKKKCSICRVFAIVAALAVLAAAVGIIIRFFAGKSRRFSDCYHCEMDDGGDDFVDDDDFEEEE